MRIDAMSVAVMVLVSILGVTQDRTSPGVQTMPRKQGMDIVRTMPHFASDNIYSGERGRAGDSKYNNALVTHEKK